LAMPLFENRETQNMNRLLHSRIDVVKNLNCVYDKFGLSVSQKVNFIRSVNILGALETFS